MIEGVNIIGFSTSKSGTETKKAFDPRNNNELAESFYLATEEEVELAVQKAERAFQDYKNYSGQQKAAFLETIADGIVDLGDTLIQRASTESGLTESRLNGERDRTVNQLRLFAKVLREGSWVYARIDTTGDAGPDIRCMLFPIGPVVVFGASNFPLAFSTAGGDTASALAAGCPVIVKAHSSHLGTNEMVANVISKAAKDLGMPDGVFSSIQGNRKIGAALVQHPFVKAVGFTGSFGGGKALYDLAQQREEPIQVYAEMSSINPVFLLSKKMESDAKALAKQYASSVTLGVGQFCTNPGLIVGLKSKGLDEFEQMLGAELQVTPPSCMLNKGIADTYRSRRAETLTQEGVESLLQPGSENLNNGAAALARVKASEFLSNDLLHEEVFGPFTLIVECGNNSEMREVADQLDGQLTLTFVGTEDELADQQELLTIGREKAGRLLFNAVPTGVRVCHAMQHGGPFPATTNSKFTSVGTSAIRRFVRPIAFQNWPDMLLPDELKSDNPLSIYRIFDGKFRK